MNEGKSVFEGFLLDFFEFLNFQNFSNNSSLLIFMNPNPNPQGNWHLGHNEPELFLETRIEEENPKTLKNTFKADKNQKKGSKNSNDLLGKANLPPDKPTSSSVDVLDFEVSSFCLKNNFLVF